MAIRSMGSTRRVRAGVLRVVGVAVLLLAGPAARAVESEDVAERLAGALRYPTVSPADPADFDGRPFVGLAGHLAASYPRVHAALDVERVADYSLLFRWRGTRPELEPVLFMSHLDVVPVDDRTRSEWTHPPFAGVVADGYVWGRGALDVKSGVVVRRWSRSSNRGWTRCTLTRNLDRLNRPLLRQILQVSNQPLLNPRG